MRKILAAMTTIGVLATGGTGWAAQQRPVVLELFTSEGCSSCPPADALLGELARNRTDVLALAFHITYWDRLGWADPYSLPLATERQRQYATLLSGSNGIYTPQMVVDGIHDVVGSDRAGVLAAVRAQQAAAASAVPMRLLREHGGVAVELGAGAGNGTVLLAGYDASHSTTVRHGENAGRTLAEANIVRDVSHAGTWRGSPVTLHAGLPDGEHVAAILQAADGQILGAARLE